MTWREKLKVESNGETEEQEEPQKRKIEIKITSSN